MILGSFLDRLLVCTAVFAQLVLDLGEIWSAIKVYKLASTQSPNEEESMATHERPVTGSVEHNAAVAQETHVKVPDKPKTPDSRTGTPNIVKRSRPSKGAKRHKQAKPMTKQEQIRSLPTDEGAALHIQSAWRGWFGRHKTAVRRFALKDMREQQDRSSEATRLKTLEMSRRLAKVRERESKKAQERTASRQQMLGKLVKIVDHTLVDHASFEDGSRPGLSSEAAMRNISQAFRHKRQKAYRQCWWLPKPLRKMLCTTKEEREHRIGVRCCAMLRRATFEHYFDVAQLEHVLRIVPKCHRIEAIVTVWSQLTDLESFRVYDYIGYDPTVTMAVDHVRDQKSFDWRAYLEVSDRIGPSNLFNPLQPEGYYQLDLRSRDCRTVAKCIMELTAEHGEHLFNQHFNDERFAANQTTWRAEVPHLGMFETEVKTPAKSANPYIRLDLGRRLLMPGHGHGRYKAVPEGNWEEGVDPKEADGEKDEQFELLPDG